MSRFVALTLACFAPLAAGAATYEVGPGKPHGSIGAVPWESLAAGDLVLIHGRAEPYAEKWVVNARGTEAAPITIRGVPTPNGNAVVDGAGATTRAALDFWNEDRGVIKIGGSNVPADGTPAWVVIEGLVVRGARPPATFTGRAGAGAYGANAAGIYVEKGEHITIRRCELTGNGNGLFVASGASDVRVEGNYLWGNGNPGSAYEHNSYTEALGIVFEGNWYGPLLAAGDGTPLALGNNLKDRSAGAEIRWNRIDGGNRALDLVDAEGSLVQDPSYAVTRVYGNVIVEHDDGLNSQVIHFGGDSGATADYRPVLHLWNNTVVSFRSGNTTLVRLSSPGQTARVWNNAIHATAAAGRLALAEGGGGIELGGNWLTAGWVPTHGTAGLVTDAGGNLSGADPGFVALDPWHFYPAEGSPLLNAASPLPDGLLPPRSQYTYLATEPRGDGGSTIGAFAPGHRGPVYSCGGTGKGGGCSAGDAGAGLLLLLPLLLRWGRRGDRR